MFHSARLKLTLWYTLSIFLVSLFFSGLIYRAAMFEIERFERRHRDRIESELGDAARIEPSSPPYIRQRSRFANQDGTEGLSPSPPSTRRGRRLPPPSPELLAEARNRVLWTLAGINLVLLSLGGGISYFLAGRTLQPIRKMMDEQARFVADASHELRTPLTAMKASCEVFLRDKTRTLKDADVLAAETLADISRLQSLTDSLLELARYDKLEKQERAAISLSDVIATARRQVSKMAKDRAITISHTDGPAYARGNRTELIRLFTILLENAVKYSPAGGAITITTVRGARYITVAVTDYGIGIDPVDLPRIFDRFFRAKNARSLAGASGFGLGLSIAKRIVESHKGSIRVVSSPGKGATFYVSLPRSASFQN